ncbi:MAG: formylglycine-generating enzyme family protein, partial [Gemmatimonadetes bacterium]|nr:formylglycine-generating enzyme family protein [Gemmatimonadota bacterium]
ARSLKHAGFERIAAGTFTMGSPEGEHGRDADEMQHAVTLTIDYEIMAHEVTQGEFGALMGYNPSGHASCGMICPVERVSWHETLKFANLLSSREGLPECFTCTGTAPDFVCGLDATYSKPQDCPGYRLPTEAEWEYAARAGSTTAYFNGAIAHTGCSPLDPNLDAIGWYCGNAAGTPHPVGEKQANAWGLYDMSGNVWEWTWDVYGFFAGDVIDPTGPGAGAGRVDRGGDYSDVAQECRSAARSAWDAAGRGGFLGFRLARSIRPAPPGLAWVSIPGGTYWMGCSPGDSGCNPSEMPRHEVTVPAFMMTETEVTQAQYMAVTGINPSGFPECGGDCPVENVTWHEAKAFCEANGGRLPSEAEWEYAARGGTATRYYCGNSDSCLDGVAWYDANSGSATHPVKGKEGNAFWLYDTLGNVWEWVGDCWHDDYTGAPSTGEVWSGGYCAFRILRGGAWHPNDNDLRSSMRDYTNDVDHYSTGGFRCVK